jgi:hypothetical protein
MQVVNLGVAYACFQELALHGTGPRQPGISNLRQIKVTTMAGRGIALFSGVMKVPLDQATAVRCFRVPAKKGIVMHIRYLEIGHFMV